MQVIPIEDRCFGMTARPKPSGLRAGLRVRLPRRSAQPGAPNRPSHFTVEAEPPRTISGACLSALPSDASIGRSSLSASLVKKTWRVKLEILFDVREHKNVIIGEYLLVSREACGE